MLPPSQVRCDLVVACGQTGSSGIILGHLVPAAPVAVALLPVESAHVCKSATPPCSLGGWVGAPHAPAAEKEMATNPSSHDGRRFIRLFGYVLAEFPPATRQRLDLPCSPLIHASNNDISIISSGRCCSAAVAIDAETTARLRGECSSRGVPLESALLASLYLAASRAAGEEGKVPHAASEGNGVHHGNISRQTNDAVRLQRALVLGVVSVVMALLSGSVDSKVLRYFCSFYAVFAGKLSSAGCAAACLDDVRLGQLHARVRSCTRWHTDCPHSCSSCLLAVIHSSVAVS